MKILMKSLLLSLCVILCAGIASAQSALVDIPVNTEKTVATATGLTGLPSSLGSPADYCVILRIAPLKPGMKYEATLTYDAGTDIGYAHAWVDGNPFEKDWASFVGIGTGTGTRELRDKQEKFIFSIDPQSTANTLYLALRSNKPFTFRFGVSDRLSGATPNSQDRWGYYFVRDFNADRTAPFLLKRGQSAVAALTPPAPRWPWVDIPVNTEKTVTTAQGLAGLPSSLGSPADYCAVLRIAPLKPGMKYEATLTYDAGTDIGYAHAWVDGNPFEKDWASFVGIGTGTGSRELRGKQEKFIFSIDPQSTANTLYLALRSNKPFTFRFGVSDRLSGVTRNSQDRWGYYFVQDFDANRTAPFLLKR
ncbi:MAG: hypothetical protein HY742_07910 [Deltaproteobacteria bacterium]|nr:hypothetical protein [Deltaproteobacteria bacterium]